MTKEDFIRKITSRKFWLAVVSFITLLLTAKGMDRGSIEQIGSIIMAGASVVAYIFAEGLVDSNRIE